MRVGCLLHVYPRRGPLGQSETGRNFMATVLLSLQKESGGHMFDIYVLDWDIFSICSALSTHFMSPFAN